MAPGPPLRFCLTGGPRIGSRTPANVCVCLTSGIGFLYQELVSCFWLLFPWGIGHPVDWLHEEGGGRPVILLITVGLLRLTPHWLAQENSSAQYRGCCRFKVVWVLAQVLPKFSFDMLVRYKSREPVPQRCTYDGWQSALGHVAGFGWF